VAIESGAGVDGCPFLPGNMPYVLHEVQFQQGKLCRRQQGSGDELNPSLKPRCSLKTNQRFIITDI
jgi:hypothetical protein